MAQGQRVCVQMSSNYCLLHLFCSTYSKAGNPNQIHEHRYGPCQFPEKLIPKFTLLASRGEELPVHGDGENASCGMEVRGCMLHARQTCNFSSLP